MTYDARYTTAYNSRKVSRKNVRDRSSYNSTNKSMGHYLLVFSLTYIGATVLITIIGVYLENRMGGMSVIIPCLSATFTGGRFMKAKNRLPTKAERKKLTNGSFLIFVGINLLLLGLAAVGGIFNEFSESLNMSTITKIVGGAFLFISMITYFMIRWAYGSLLTKQAAKMNLNRNTFD